MLVPLQGARAVCAWELGAGAPAGCCWCVRLEVWVLAPLLCALGSLDAGTTKFAACALGCLVPLQGASVCALVSWGAGSGAWLLVLLQGVAAATCPLRSRVLRALPHRNVFAI